MGNSVGVKRGEVNASVTTKRTRLRESVRGKIIPASPIRRIDQDGDGGGGDGEGGGGDSAGDGKGGVFERGGDGLSNEGVNGAAAAVNVNGETAELNFFAHFSASQSSEEITAMNNVIGQMLKEQKVNRCQDTDKEVMGKEKKGENGKEEEEDQTDKKSTGKKF